MTRQRRKPEEIPPPSGDLLPPEGYRPGGGRPTSPRAEPTPEPIHKPILPAAEVPSIEAAELIEAGLLPPEEPRVRKVSAFKLQEMRRLLAEMARRQCESLRLYQPLPVQRAFHASQAPRRILRGSNRGGKTTPALVDLCWALTGTHPFRHFPKENGRAYIIGKSETHISETFYPKLFKAGAMRMIRDAETRVWRTFHPVLDAGRDPREVKYMPPLLPRRLIADEAWKDKKKRVFKTIRLHNGWELTAFASGGDPPQGSDIDYCLCDEEVDPKWYSEMMARLVDRSGCFVWSATPQDGREQLLQLSETAAKLKELRDPNPAVEEFFISIFANDYLEQAKKDEFIAALSDDPEQYNVRVMGEFAALGYMMFPEFHLATHGVETALNGRDEKEYSKPYDYLPGGVIPDGWCRYAVVDPGYQVCAVLFAAVPPPSVGDHVYLYDELYLQGCDAEMFGRAMRNKTGGQTFHAFVIDEHGSRRSETGTGTTIKKQYSDALKKYGVRSEQTGHGFISGSDDVAGRCMKVRSWLGIRDNGTTKLRVLKDRLPNLCREFKRYRRKVIEGVIQDQPNDRKHNHLMQCLQYLAAHGAKYNKPKPGAARLSYAVRRLKEKRDKRRDGKYVNLGPGKAT